MRPAGKPGELFAAFSRINARAFTGDSLLSCPLLSKAPNYGDILRRFLTAAPIKPLTALELARAAFSYCVTNGGHLLFLLLSRLYLSLLGWKMPACLTPGTLRQNGSRLFIIDSFALLPGIAEKGRFQEGYLPGLWEEIQAQGHQPVRLYRLYGSRHPKVLWQAMQTMVRSGDGITEAHLFTWTDWLALCRHCLTYPFALRGLIRSLDHFPPSSPEAYIREALLRTAGQNILSGEARRLAGLRLGLLLATIPAAPTTSSVIAPAAPGTSPTASSTASPAPQNNSGSCLISWYENQTVDKALHRGLTQAEGRTKRHIPSLGAQLFIWPDTLLNNHPDDAEAALGLTPDRILVNGPFFMPEESRQPYAVGPALRYGHVFTQAVEPGKAASPALPLLALLSYHPDETRRVLDLLLPLVRKGLSVHYKFHPATRPTDYAASLPDKPVLVSGALTQALSEAGAVIGAGSGSLAEAAALGVPVLAVQDPSGIPGLDLQYLPPLGQGQLWEHVRTAQDIEPALERLHAFRASPDHSALTHAFRDQIFTKPTPEAIREVFLL